MIASVNWGVSGVTLSYSILDRSTGLPVVESETITEEGTSGVYQVDTAYAMYPYRITWTDGSGNYALEDFEVGAPMVASNMVAAAPSAEAIANEWITVLQDNGLIEADVDGIRFTENALEEAPGTTAPTAEENANMWTVIQMGNGLVEADGEAVRFTENALEEAPSGGAGSDPLLNPVPGSYPIGTAGRVLGSINPNRVTFLNPVSDDTNALIYRGASYLSDIGTQLEFTNTPTVTMSNPDIFIVIDGVSYPAEYAANVVTLELDAATTALFGFSVTSLACIAMGATDEVQVLFEGTLSVRDFEYVRPLSAEIPVIYRGASYTVAMGTPLTLGPFTLDPTWIITAVIDELEYDVTVVDGVVTLELTGAETDAMDLGILDLCIKATAPDTEYAILYATTVHVSEAIV